MPEEREESPAAAEPAATLPPRIKFEPLREEHRPLVLELLARYSHAELISLAERLPPDLRAADAVWPTPVGIRPTTLAAFIRRNAADAEVKLAIYIAAAAQGGAARQLEEVLRRQKATHEMLAQLKDLLDDSRARGAGFLLAAMSGKEPPG